MGSHLSEFGFRSLLGGVFTCDISSKNNARFMITSTEFGDKRNRECWSKGCKPIAQLAGKNARVCRQKTVFQCTESDWSGDFFYHFTHFAGQEAEDRCILVVQLLRTPTPEPNCARMRRDGTY